MPAIAVNGVVTRAALGRFIRQFSQRIEKGRAYQIQDSNIPEFLSVDVQPVKPSVFVGKSSDFDIPYLRVELNDVNNGPHHAVFVYGGTGSSSSGQFTYTNTDIRSNEDGESDFTYPVRYKADIPRINNYSEPLPSADEIKFECRPFEHAAETYSARRYYGGILEVLNLLTCNTK